MSEKRSLFIVPAVLLVLMILYPVSVAVASDWPMWRCDANRSACSPDKLPEKLSLRWTLEYGSRIPAWEDPLNQDLMSFDTVFEPVVAGNRMFVPFNDCDKLVAIDIRTGQEVWVFYAEGPVRLAPAVSHGRVYFTSDDGCLYCLRADNGGLEWKFKAAPSDYKVLGNGRLVSAWPARGGPVIRDGVVYFAASIWPFMGTFIHAIDAATGRIIWTNDGTGADYIKQPHNAPAFAGVAPQGALVATEDILLVPGGRSVPAAFNRATGNLLYFRIAESGKGTGGSTIMADDKTFFVHTRGRGVRSHELSTGARTSFAIGEPVLGRNNYYCAADHSSARGALSEAEAKLESARYGELKERRSLDDARDSGDDSAIKRATMSLASAEKKFQRAQDMVVEVRSRTSTTGLKKVVQSWNMDKTLQWEIEADGSGDIICAGNRLYAGGASFITAIELPAVGGQPSIAWKLPVEGRIGRLFAAGGMLFAVTREGRILAFGEGDVVVPSRCVRKPCVVPLTPAALEKAQAIVSRSGAHAGYALCLGVEDASSLSALAATSDLRIIGVDADAKKIEHLRHEIDTAGIYGLRVALMVGNPGVFGAPPYIASLVMVGKAQAAALSESEALRKIYECVRPYGGSLWFSSPPDVAALAAKIRAVGLVNARIEIVDDSIMVVREGSLPGAADWTHQYGDVANTVKSDDRLVRLPLGVLWFGGNTHMDVLPRHGHGPSQQVIGGRLFLQGTDGLSARDVYTGRRLWKTVISDLDTRGIYFDDTLLDDPMTTLYSQRHMSGANARGANFVATDESVYVAVSNRCVVLDAVTGHIVSSIVMSAPEWAYIAVCDDLLLGGTGFAHYNRRFSQPDLVFLTGLGDYAASAGLAVFDRHSGRMIWRTEARHSFLNNGIVAGGGRVYCLDRLPKSAEIKAARRGETPGAYRIVAFDLRTGKKLWEQTREVFGTWLSYSKTHDLLLQAGARATDRLKDEVGQGMAVLRAKDGSEVWRQDAIKYDGPCILHNDLILTTPGSYKASAGAYSLLDGKPHNIVNPLTGELQPWRVYRTYGCNTPVASEYLMTFRSGAAGFYDLAGHGGTGNLGGFKSGCSANLIVANGVLNAPDYTRTCSCPYQNQTSLAFVSMPQVELWTYNLAGLDMPPGRRIVRVGVNLGAPGDRLDDGGTLWLDHPAGQGLSPHLPVTVTPADAVPFRRHASAVAGNGPVWVVASGMHGIESIQIGLQTIRTNAIQSSSSDSDDEDDNSRSDGKNKSTAIAVSPGPSPTPLMPANYTIRLFFMEPDLIAPGQRVFDVLLQGRVVLKAFDVLRAAGAPNHGVVREFKGVCIADDLEIRFRKAPSSKLGSILSGVEIVLE